MTRANRLIRCALLLSVWAILSQRGVAQTPGKASSVEDLPPAPQPQVAQSPARSMTPAEPQVALIATFPRGAASQIPSSAAPQAVPSPQTPNGPLHLNRTQAEQLAIKNNPRISVGRLLALAQHQVFRETRAAELPNFNGAITAVDANEGSRIGAGALTASRLLEHAGAGVVLSQLITDFGRTTNLVASSKLQ